MGAPRVNRNARGLAIRFALAERVHTDIIGHARDGFPTRTGQEFLELLRASAASGTSKAPIEAFLAAHPAALAFVQTRHFGVTPMRRYAVRNL